MIYIFGDNGSSAEGQNGSISELLAQNQIPNTVAQQLAALNALGGLDALGGPKVDNMYHAGWAWAGDTPLRYTKLIASHFGGTRNPMAISWPARIKPDKTPRSQFHHVNDIVPTIYELLGISRRRWWTASRRTRSTVSAWPTPSPTPTAPGRKRTQYFDNNGSRGIYHDGWYRLRLRAADAVAHGEPGSRHLGLEQGRLGALRPRGADFSQADDLAAKEPQAARRDEGVVPEGSEGEPGLPDRRRTSGCASTRKTASRRRTRAGSSTRRRPACREFTAPGLGRESNHVTVDADLGENASGVLVCAGRRLRRPRRSYMDQGASSVYEYNVMIIERTTPLRLAGEAGARQAHDRGGRPRIAKPGAPAEVVLTVDGKEVARTTVQRTVPAAFTASETFDVGVDLGSPVSMGIGRPPAGRALGARRRWGWHAAAPHVRRGPK